MPDAYQSDGRSSVKRGLAKIAYDFAALKMEFLARRYGVEIKYDPHQFRVPAGQRTGGQWAKTPSGSVGAKRTAGSLGARALGALASNPEAAPAAGAVALPLMAGGIGISRAEGLYAVGTGAASGMTPFLGLPFSLITPPTAPITNGSLGQRNAGWWRINVLNMKISLQNAIS